MPAAPPLSLLARKPIASGTLRGFAVVRIGKALKISDVAVHTGNGRRWAHLPAKPALDRDGSARRDDRGKVKYIPIIEWLDKTHADWFSNAVIEAVEREHPHALDAQEGG